MTLNNACKSFVEQKEQLYGKQLAINKHLRMEISDCRTKRTQFLSIDARLRDELVRCRKLTTDTCDRATAAFQARWVNDRYRLLGDRWKAKCVYQNQLTVALIDNRVIMVHSWKASEVFDWLMCDHVMGADGRDEMEAKIGMKKAQHEKDLQQKRVEATEIYRVTHHGRSLAGFMNTKEQDRIELRMKENGPGFDRRHSAGTGTLCDRW